MPRMCSVPGCSSNYHRHGGSTITTFAFPKDPQRRELWVKSINRANFVPGSSACVCIKHFSEQFIVRVDTARRDDGTILEVPRVRPKLTDDAYPSLFANQPLYLSSEPPAKRKHPDERRNEILKRDEENFQEWIKSDIIECFDNFKQKYKVKVPDYFTAIENPSSVYFFKIDTTECPCITVSLKVDSNLNIQVWHGNIEIPSTMFQWVLGSHLRCDRWTKFESLCSHLIGYTVESLTNEQKLNIAAKIIEGCVGDSVDNSAQLRKLNFLREQVDLTAKHVVKYSPSTLFWACSLFFSNASAYCKLRESGVLTIPHPSYIRKLSVNLGSPQSGFHNSHLIYLKEKLKSLRDTEKYVNLLIDEIHVFQNFSYKGGNIEGAAQNKVVSATTVQAFQISSLFSSNNDIVALCPVTKLDSSTLFELTMKVVRVLSESGYIIVSVIADNNRVNRNMFEKAGNGELKCSITNPFVENHEIFLLFDSVHLLKSIRNNWMNQKDENKTFAFPNFEKEGSLHACVGHLRHIYLEEKTSHAKLAPNLNKKVLMPNNLERQNVNLAVRLFDEKSIAALQVFETKEGNEAMKGTREFIYLIRRWWKIINVRHPLQGRNLREPFSNPIRTMDDDNIIFLSNFVTWLDKWKNLPSLVQSSSRQRSSGQLTCETFTALKHTTMTLIRVCAYLLKDINVQYVLLGKFSTDDLEGRFSRYRQMSGGNYRVSVRQLIESERKLKIVSLLKMHSASCGEFPLKDFLCSCKEVAKEERLNKNVDELYECMKENIDEVLCTTHQEMALIYIAGYVAFKVKDVIHCHACIDFIVYKDKLNLECENVESVYLSLLDRGSLQWPKECLNDMIQIVFKVFEILISDKFERSFLECNNQRLLLKELSLLRIEEEMCLDYACHCKMQWMQIAEKCVSVATNIFLNNYCKNKNEKELGNRGNKRKLSTLTNC